MEYGESTRERAERYKQPVSRYAGLAEFSNGSDGYDDGLRLPGELPRYTLG
jgi:hypothetical protein